MSAEQIVAAAQRCSAAWPSLTEAQIEQLRALLSGSAKGAQTTVAIRRSATALKGGERG